MSSIAYKPYPSGFVVHPIIDACLEIALFASPSPGSLTLSAGSAGDSPSFPYVHAKFASTCGSLPG